MIGNIAVILIIMFLSAMIYRGTRRGVIKLVYSVAVLTVSILISQILAVPIGDAIRNNEKIHNMIKEKTDVYVEVNIRPEIEKMQQEAGDMEMEELSLPTAVTKTFLKDTIEKEKTKGTDAICNAVSEGIVILCLRALVSITIFVLVFFAMRVIGTALDVFSKLPGIRYVNKGIGGCVGFLQGVLVLWLLCLVLMCMTGTEYGDKVYSVVNENEVLSFIYDTNPIVKMYRV